MDLTDFEDVLQQNCRVKKSYPRPGYQTQMVNHIEVVECVEVKPRYLPAVIIPILIFERDVKISGKHCLPHLCCDPEDVFASIERCKICDKYI